ncbi:DUF2393 family protein [Candidatus Sulfurimonas baltica]|uniref:DUF2393 family protein n=1 Tax=Candidatus Sulfurimonas baltica TaxID=2740404 RepID=A0A7S7RMU9_9BACT|nr:DUF2393 family protein [Candidatus Sulfurimonas baltica]QOY51836.1 DUF2393 family protein [Candidatus Sulfurimonas baltica]
MITLFNYWHFIVLSLIFLIFLSGVYAAFKQDQSKLRFPMIISASLISVLLAGFSVVAVDKYTKIVKLYRLDNKRMLSSEKIMYSGIVKNEGKHEVGEVIFEIKLVNKGHVTGNVKAGSFFSPSGFFDFFSGGAGVLYKPQQVKEEFIVAKNLKAGEAREFRVYLDYPPYFRSTSQFTKIYAH